MIGALAMISMSILMLSLFLGFAGLIRARNLPDKVVALNLIGVIFLGILLAYIFLSKEIIFLDVGGATILIVFIGTIMVGRYLIRETHDD
jgi:multicomponent Na+:H+ antiporter subunit F